MAITVSIAGEPYNANVNKIAVLVEEREIYSIAVQPLSLYTSMAIVSVTGEPYHVGNLAILGGELEMPWRFDRLFKLEITEALTALGLNYDDDFEVHVDITDSNGNKLSENTYSHDTILHEPAHGECARGQLPFLRTPRSLVRGSTCVGHM